MDAVGPGFGVSGQDFTVGQQAVARFGITADLPDKLRNVKPGHFNRDIGRALGAGRFNNGHRKLGDGDIAWLLLDLGQLPDEGGGVDGGRWRRVRHQRGGGRIGRIFRLALTGGQ